MLFSVCFRLLMELYSFLYANDLMQQNKNILSFRLLMELYSFLYPTGENDMIYAGYVSVSLWSYIHSYKPTRERIKIPKLSFVSVSLWSYIHSYSPLSKSTIVSVLIIVSVSLWSYIHSYY